MTINKPELELSFSQPGVSEKFYGDHWTSVSDKIDQKMKVGQNFRFFLEFFPRSFQPVEAEVAHMCTCVPSDHGDHGH